MVVLFRWALVDGTIQASSETAVSKYTSDSWTKNRNRAPKKFIVLLWLLRIGIFNMNSHENSTVVLPVTGTDCIKWEVSMSSSFSNLDKKCRVGEAKVLKKQSIISHPLGRTR